MTYGDDNDVDTIIITVTAPNATVQCNKRVRIKSVNRRTNEYGTLRI